MTEAHTHIDAALFGSVPVELQSWLQWVVWRYEDHGGPKPDKVPYSIRGGYAKTNDPATWGTFAEALTAYQMGGYDGIGFVFTASDPFAGVDLDSCRDPATGKLEAWAAEIVKALDSYTETSPSGTGVKIFLQGKLPRGKHVQKIENGQIEVYDTRRFFTLTADHLGGTPTTIEDRQVEIENVHARIFGKPHAKQTSNRNSKKTAPNLTRIKEALQHIPATDYDTWLRVGMALRAAGDENLDLWIAWSRTCPEKFDLDVCHRKWRSFSADRESGVTLATIIQLAKDAGWTPSGNGHTEAPWPGDAGAPREQTRSDDDEAENLRCTAQERPVEDEAKLKRGEYAPVILCAKDVTPEEVDWLWYPYLPRRKIGLLGGDAGLGKTWLALSFASSNSLGHWPFYFTGKESLREPSNTVFFSTEDGVADTLVPRLISLGADLNRIFFVEGKKDWKGTLHRVVLNDASIITRSIKAHNATLAVFDPFQGFLPPKTKMNEMETVRPVLSSLIQTAHEADCFLLLVGHLNKSKQESAAYKFMGSVDWYAAARSALMVVADPENPAEGRIFYQVKNSLDA
jgi:hypothetical protein